MISVCWDTEQPENGAVRGVKRYRSKIISLNRQTDNFGSWLLASDVCKGQELDKAR